MLIGRERSPALVIDNFLSNPDVLIEYATRRSVYEAVSNTFYPGIRAPIPAIYSFAVRSFLGPAIGKAFGLDPADMTRELSHFSLVTTPPEKLKGPQRIPHLDNTNPKQLAILHYLCGPEFGGTSFYRHRRTGFETIDDARSAAFGRGLKEDYDAFEVQAVMHMRNAAGLQAYATAASDPHSAYYRKFLTPQQIADNFAAPAADYANAVAYLHSYGLHVVTYKQREMLRVWGNQSSLERAFGTRFGVFRRGTSRLTAPVSTPHVPNSVHIDALAGAVAGLHLMHTDSIVGGPPTAYSSGRIAGYSPFQIASAFDYQGAYEAGYTGKGVTLGVIGTGPVTPLEVSEYHKIFNVPVTGTFTIVPGVANTAYGDGAGDTTPPPPTDNEFDPCTQPASGTDYTKCNPEDGEAQLDAEQQTSLAPGANVRNYLAYNANETTCSTPPIVTPIGTVPPECTTNSVTGSSGPEIGLDLYEDELQAEIDENLADSISLSFGSCDTLEEAEQNPSATGDGFDHNEYASIVAEGTAIFVSSGDSGPEGCAGGLVDVPNASSPADDPNIVAVGGTNTPIDSNGKLEGPLTLWGAETKDDASGVGPSSIYMAPAFQTSAGLSAICTFRCIPDVDLEGDPTTGVSDLEYPAAGKGADVPIGGTSVSAPQMAAIVGARPASLQTDAEVRQRRHERRRCRLTRLSLRQSQSTDVRPVHE